MAKPKNRTHTLSKYWRVRIEYMTHESGPLVRTTGNRRERRVAGVDLAIRGDGADFEHAANVIARWLTRRYGRPPVDEALISSRRDYGEMLIAKRIEEFRSFDVTEHEEQAQRIDDERKLAVISAKIRILRSGEPCGRSYGGNPRVGQTTPKSKGARARVRTSTGSEEL